jgi:hypothetical protein
MKTSLFAGLALVLYIFMPSASGAACIDSDGEALIVRGDIPAAKMEAMARAKWQAIEQTVGVEIKANSVVQNMVLVDEAISKKVKGLVTGSKILSEEQRGELYHVRINACVEPATAQQAVKILARNNALAVLIPLNRPHSETADEANILSETLISKLTEQGYTVTDVVKSSGIETSAIENALKSGAFSALSGISAKHLARMLLIGKLDYTVSTRKGENIGYGLAMPFNHVTVRLTYRLLARNDADKIVIIDAGTREAKGLAGNVDDAVANALQDLAQDYTPTILKKIAKHVSTLAEKVAVRVEGIKTVADNLAVKEVLQQTSWVTAVEERGLGDFTVTYPENTVYLANSLAQKENLAISQFTPESVTLTYRSGQ